MQVGYSVQKT